MLLVLVADLGELLEHARLARPAATLLVDRLVIITIMIIMRIIIIMMLLLIIIMIIIMIIRIMTIVILIVIASQPSLVASRTQEGFASMAGGLPQVLTNSNITAVITISLLLLFLLLLLLLLVILLLLLLLLRSRTSSRGACPGSSRPSCTCRGSGTSAGCRCTGPRSTCVVEFYPVQYSVLYCVNCLIV